MCVQAGYNSTQAGYQACDSCSYSNCTTSRPILLRQPRSHADQPRGHDSTYSPVRYSPAIAHILSGRRIHLGHAHFTRACLEALLWRASERPPDVTSAPLRRCASPPLRNSIILVGSHIAHATMLWHTSHSHGPPRRQGCSTRRPLGRDDLPCRRRSRRRTHALACAVESVTVPHLRRARRACVSACIQPVCSRIHSRHRSLPSATNRRPASGTAPCGRSPWGLPLTTVCIDKLHHHELHHRSPAVRTSRQTRRVQLGSRGDSGRTDTPSPKPGVREPPATKYLPIYPCGRSCVHPLITVICAVQLQRSCRPVNLRSQEPPSRTSPANE